MRHTSFIIISLLFSILSFGQKSKLAISGHYGLATNFFVRSYEEDGGPAIPNRMYFYKKNLLGTIGGVELNYDLNSYSSLGATYSRTTNKGRKNYQGQNGSTELIIRDFQLRHINDFFQVFYERNFTKNNPTWKYHAGLVYARMHQQELESLPNLIFIDERNFKNSRLEEGGVFGGIQYAKRIDTHFDFGLKARIYYLVSVQQLEAITLTPVLTYHF
jgi:hypothetical protein